MSDMLRVGLIGANARSGWARDSHVPAIQALRGLSLAAVATNSRDTADEAAEAFGAKGYASGLALIADPAIDIVTVATRVPDHRALVLAAIEAGKHVYSEWPLGRGQGESAEMAEAARRAGVHSAIGLQLRESSTVRRAGDLLASGAIGRVLSMSGFSSVAGFGPEVPPPFAYLEDPASFANLVTIQGAHMIDLAAVLIGPPARLDALASRQFPDITIGEARHRRTIFDHLLVQGRSADGVPFALEVAGGRSPDTPFHLEIVGEKGVLRLGGSAPRGLQSGRLWLARDGKAVPIDERELAGLPDAGVNVGGVYARLRDDILGATHGVAGFDRAERLTALVEAILDTGRFRAG
jgi:predicted dehydrogenase